MREVYDCDVCIARIRKLLADFEDSQDALRLSIRLFDEFAHARSINAYRCIQYALKELSAIYFQDYDMDLVDFVFRGLRNEFPETWSLAPAELIEEIESYRV